MLILFSKALCCSVAISKRESAYKVENNTVVNQNENGPMIDPRGSPLINFTHMMFSSVISHSISFSVIISIFSATVL